MIKTQGGNSVRVIYVLARVERKSTYNDQRPANQ